MPAEKRGHHINIEYRNRSGEQNMGIISGEKKDNHSNHQYLPYDIICRCRFL